MQAEQSHPFPYLSHPEISRSQNTSGSILNFDQEDEISRKWESRRKEYQNKVSLIKEDLDAGNIESSNTNEHQLWRTRQTHINMHIRDRLGELRRTWRKMDTTEVPWGDRVHEGKEQGKTIAEYTVSIFCTIVCRDIIERVSVHLPFHKSYEKQLLIGSGWC